MPKSSLIVIDPSDTVAIALEPLAQGDALPDTGRVKGRVPAGHKVALRAVKSGEQILRYGQIIGIASADIQVGEHVHSHNLTMGDFNKDYAYSADRKPQEPVKEDRTFLGFRRPNGTSATRNYIGILTTVNCSAHVAHAVARMFERHPASPADPLEDYPNVDGVVALTHTTGCGMSSGEPLKVLQQTIRGYAKHPNFSHVLLLGLGCEVNQIGSLLNALPDRERVHAMTIQGTGGTRKTIDAAATVIRGWLDESHSISREPIPLSELCVALICGGSDGYSGISANPALGVASDLVISHGGTVILSETPETYGAEHLLTRRAVSEDVGKKLVYRMRWWQAYGATQGLSMDANPTPGNKRGGLTTILEKSLGALSKGGSSNLMDVVTYAQQSDQKGLVFMDSPGYDPVQVTGQIAAGANIVAFTTGRGSVFGSKPSPTIKLSSNTNMFHAMNDDMDINCGGILDGTDTVDSCGKRIFESLIATASGKKSKSESLNFGSYEFIPWIIGPVI